MFNDAYVENAPEKGLATLQVLGDNARFMMFVPLQRVELSGELTGPVAGMQVVHVFGYSKQQCSRVIEAVYRFPLPGDAAVTGVSVRFGDVEIQAVLEPRAQAEQEYEQAKKERKQAALVTREGADVFTLRVAGIKPGQEVRVETAFVQLARAEGAGWSLRIPLTVAQRYMRQDEDWRARGAAPLAQAVDPGYRATLDLTIFDGAGVASPTHALAFEQDGPELHVRFQEGEVVPDSDAVITWQPAGDERSMTISAFSACREQSTSFLALVTPPLAEQHVLPRELTVLVDHSGSMQGAKWDAADWAVKRLIGMLTEGDRFRLGVFHSTVAWWRDAPVPMGDAARADAVHFLESHRDTGGTELGVALEQALRAERPAGQFSRQVLIVTDAQVGDSGRLLRLAGDEARRADRRRLSILCIDSAPNEALARQLAEAGGGSDRYVTSNPEGEDITTALDAIVDTWARPIATGLRLEVQAPAAYATSRPTVHALEQGWTALDVGDLPAGKPVWVSGEVDTGGSPLALRLVDGSGAVLATWAGSSGMQQHPAVAALVGARRLQVLEALRGALYTPEELKKHVEELGIASPEAGQETGTLYPENQSADELLARLIRAESLHSGLISSETAFVAVRTQASKSVERTVIVASAFPEGWKDAEPAIPLSRGLVYDVSTQPLEQARFKKASVKTDRLYASGPDTYVRPRAPRVTLFDGTPEGAGRIELVQRTIGLNGATGLVAGCLTSILAEGDAGAFPDGTELLLFVGDMARPRARVRLSDLLGGGVRPLSITCTGGQVLRLVLQVPGTAGGPLGRLKVTLGVA